MFLFGKFKTSFNVNNGLKRRGKHEEVSYGMSEITGAYRINRNEFSVDGNYSESQGKAKRTAPVVPAVPAYQPQAPIRQKRAPNPPTIPTQQQPDPRLTKSTSDLIKDKNLPPPIRQAQSGVSLDPRGASENRRGSVIVDTTNKRQLDAHKRVEKKRQEEQKKAEKQRLEEEKKLEKQRLEEQKKREKLALQEQARQDKLRKESEKKQKKTKRAAPQRPLANPLAQSASQANNPASQSTNTLNSSISKTSGPPPYTDALSEVKAEGANKSNVQFSKPEDTGSWDMVSQHRQNVIVNKRANPTQPVKGQTTIDLNYTLGDSKSDA